MLQDNEIVDAIDTASGMFKGLIGKLSLPVVQLHGPLIAVQ